MCNVEKTFYHKLQTTICGDLMICENKHRVEHRARYLLLLLSDIFSKSDQVKTIEKARWDLVRGDRDRLP